MKRHAGTDEHQRWLATLPDLGISHFEHADSTGRSWLVLTWGQAGRFMYNVRPVDDLDDMTYGRKRGYLTAAKARAKAIARVEGAVYVSRGTIVVKRGHES